MSRAEREKPAESYRADLVVHFAGGGWVHVEVKIGDLDLAKAPATTQALRSVVGAGFKRDYLLLPAADVSYWDDVKTGLDGADTITILTWHDVAKDLRASVRERDAEDLRWRVWAATFLGAVEQRRLGFRQVVADEIALARYRPSGRDVERVRILEKLLKERS